MKLRLTLLLAILLFLVACTKKEETPATSVQPNSPQPAAPAPDQNAAAQPPAQTPAAAPAQTPAAAPVQQAAAPAAAPVAKPTPPPPPKPVVIPAGTALTIRTTTPLGSDKSKTGDTFHATLAEPVELDGKVVVPEGADILGTVVDAQKKGKIKGEARLELTLNSMSIKGVKYPIATTMTNQTAKGKGKRTAATTAGGAGLGAIIGGIAGGGKGAGIGALVGGGAGFVGGAFTGNKQIEVPAETALVFKLNSPITLK
jgi:hypothetical protein